MFAVRCFYKSPDSLSWPRTSTEGDEWKRILTTLQNPSTPEKMRERLIMELRRITNFREIQSGNWVPEENKAAVAKILAGKDVKNYYASDLLSLKRRGVDIVPLLLADPYSPDRPITWAGLNQSQRLFVNFWSNPNLEGTIGAWDILPPDITVISVGGNIGIRREEPRPGYYGENWLVSIRHGDTIQIVEKRSLSEFQMDKYREASHKRWALVRASDMIEYNNKNPLTDLPEDRSLFSDGASLSRKVNQPRNIGRSTRDSLNIIKNWFTLKPNEFRSFALSRWLPAENTDDVLRVMTAIFQHESGWSYTIEWQELSEWTHKWTRAIWRYQIMPINWQNWSREIFSTVVPTTPENQDKIAFYQMMKNHLQHSRINSSPDYYVREMALDWYWRGRVSATTNNNFNSKAPSTKEYADRILYAYKKLG